MLCILQPNKLIFFVLTAPTFQVLVTNNCSTICNQLCNFFKKTAKLATPQNRYQVCNAKRQCLNLRLFRHNVSFFLCCYNFGQKANNNKLVIPSFHFMVKIYSCIWERGSPWGSYSVSVVGLGSLQWILITKHASNPVLTFHQLKKKQGQFLIIPSICSENKQVRGQLSIDICICKVHSFTYIKLLGGAQVIAGATSTSKPREG